MRVILCCWRKKNTFPLPLPPFVLCLDKLHFDHSIYIPLRNSSFKAQVGHNWIILKDKNCKYKDLKITMDMNNILGRPPL